VAACRDGPRWRRSNRAVSMAPARTTGARARLRLPALHRPIRRIDPHDRLARGAHERVRDAATRREVDTPLFIRRDDGQHLFAACATNRECVGVFGLDIIVVFGLVCEFTVEIWVVIHAEQRNYEAGRSAVRPASLSSQRAECQGCRWFRNLYPYRANGCGTDLHRSCRVSPIHATRGAQSWRA